jgi:hypothetical protein
MMALRYVSRPSDYSIPSASEVDILHGVQRVVVFKLSGAGGPGAIRTLLEGGGCGSARNQP